MMAALAARLGALAESRAQARRQAVALAAREAGVEDVGIEGDLVRLSGRGLMRRWMADLALREAGRGGR